MVIIDTSTQSISMTRGDYAALVFSAYEDDGVTLHELANGDKVQLQISKKYGTEAPLTKVKVKDTNLSTTDLDYTIELLPEDTKDLKFGDYFYDVSILTTDGNVITYIGDSGDIQPKFTILKEVGGLDG